MEKHLCGITLENIKELEHNQIFVYGSNLAGVNGAGAAKQAQIYFGAIHGKGTGLNGKSYALPTKNYYIATLGLKFIEIYVDDLLQYIHNNPNKHFLITKIGCGLAGYEIKEIAPLFKNFLNIKNCSLPIEFINHNINN